MLWRVHSTELFVRLFATNSLRDVVRWTTTKRTNLLVGSAHRMQIRTQISPSIPSYYERIYIYTFGLQFG